MAWRRHMNNKKAMGFVMGVLLICRGGWVFAQNATYTPIGPEFGFPAAQAELLKYRDAQDVAKMRDHAWMIFAGMTQPADPQNPSSETVWETWYSRDELFPPRAQPQAC